jgi:hypothetical protein
MSILSTTQDEITTRLADAQRRLERAIKALAPKHEGGEWEEYNASAAAVLKLERELAAAKGEEHAVPLDFPVRWDIGAPLPQVVHNDYKTFLTFYVCEPDPNWDGSDVTVKDPGDGSVESLALVEFLGCASARLGSPNDEVFKGHPLSGKGLNCYTAQRVVNSKWLAELEAINSVHRRYDPARWRILNHYVFWFHDSTFECVAESFTVELFRESVADLLTRVCQRLVT